MDAHDFARVLPESILCLPIFVVLVRKGVVDMFEILDAEVLETIWDWMIASLGAGQPVLPPEREL